MRRKYEEIEVSFISNAKYYEWTRCAKCGDELCKEPMFSVKSNVLRSLSNIEAHYCIECAPSKKDARELFDKTYINPPRPIAPPPPPGIRTITLREGEWKIT